MLETMTTNIAAFLRDKEWMTGDIENAGQWFPQFWDRIGASGDLSAALEGLDYHYNAFDRPEGVPSNARLFALG